MPYSIRVSPDPDDYNNPPRGLEHLDSVQRETKWVTGIARPGDVTTSVVIPKSKSNNEIIVKGTLVWTTILSQIAQDVSVPEAILFTALSCILPILFVLITVAIPQHEVSSGKFRCLKY
jgi:hypothetical protein